MCRILMQNQSEQSDLLNWTLDTQVVKLLTSHVASLSCPPGFQLVTSLSAEQNKITT